MVDENEVRNRLIAKQTELNARIAGTQANARQQVSEGDSDSAHQWEDSDIRDDLDAQASNELRQVEDALARLDAGEYGVCQECEEPISEGRLRAVPYATLCIRCAEKAEQSS